MRKSKNKNIRRFFLGAIFASLSFSFLLGVNTKREVRVGDITSDVGIVYQIGVEDVGRTRVQPFVTPTDTEYNTQKTYSMNNVGNIEATWDYYTGEDVLIAIIDSGIVYNHEDFYDSLGNSILSNDSGYIYTDFEAQQIKIKYATSDNWDCMKHDYDSYWSEWDTHGSNVAGSAAAALNNVGTVGIAPKAKILALKIDFYLSSVGAAIQYAADCGADVINLSLGAYDSGDPGPNGGGDGVATYLADVIDYARNTKGSIVIAAAGNENTSARSYPACNDGVIGVGALYKNSSTNRASFSNFNKSNTPSVNDNVDLMAPGYVWAAGLEGTQLDNPSTTYPDPGYSATQGTSFASPIVAGAAALWKEKHPTGTPDQFETALYDSVVPLSGFQYYGRGRLDVYELLDIANEGAPTLSVEELNLTPTSSPVTVTATSTTSTIKSWSTSDTGVFTFSNVTGLDTASSSAKVNVVGEGNATLTVTDHLNRTTSIPVIVATPQLNHTITFKQNASDGSTALVNQDDFLAEVTSGANIISSVTNVSRVYAGQQGLKLSSGSGNGQFTLNLDQSYTITKVVLSAAQYGTEASTLAVNGGTAQSINGNTLTDYTFNFDGTAISSITINAYKRNYIGGITLHFGAALTPTVTSVTVTPSTLALDLYSNPSSTLSATVNGTNNPSQEVTWSSSDATTATVSSSGLVTALKTGTVTITATSVQDTSKSGTCDVTISDTTPPAPTNILTQDSPYMNGVAYKMYFYNTSKASEYYFTGTMNGYYGATSTVKSAGVNVFFEESGTGQNIYFMNSGVKNYFYVEDTGTHINFKFGTAVPTTTWTYYSTRNVIAYEIASVLYTFGTHGTYTTFAAFKIEQYPDNYKVQFVTTNQSSATDYANAFSKYLTCDATGNSTPTFTSPKSWNVYKLAFDSLDQSAKTVLVNATANPAGTEVEKAMARYDYIVAKYGTATYIDFIGRAPSSPVNFKVFAYNKNQLIYIIVFTLVASIAFAGYIGTRSKQKKTY
ncbi:MAG TPA: S8 family serine peptidase [Bacilli bacterium]|nr:S8 family serine peptidase [Bacilli bacterium]HPK86046.1 S8 family serine peptidase [Bacilli bacterium]